jgi:hypothetical protein
MAQFYPLTPLDSASDLLLRPHFLAAFAEQVRFLSILLAGIVYRLYEICSVAVPRSLTNTTFTTHNRYCLYSIRSPIRYIDFTMYRLVVSGSRERASMLAKHVGKKHFTSDGSRVAGCVEGL